MVAVAGDKGVEIYEVIRAKGLRGVSLRRVKKLDFNREIYVVAWSKKGLLAASTYSELYIISAKNWSVISQYDIFTRSMEWSPDGEMLAVGDRELDRLLIVLYNGSAFDVTIKGDGVSWVAWSRDGEKLLVACYNGFVYVIPRSELKAVKKPPSLTLFSPEINGLEVTINGVVKPGSKYVTITRIHWDWGDGHEEDSWLPATHVYSSPGTYTVTVTVYQSDGLTTTKTLTITVEKKEETSNPPSSEEAATPQSGTSSGGFNYTSSLLAGDMPSRNICCICFIYKEKGVWEGKPLSKIPREVRGTI